MFCLFLTPSFLAYFLLSNVLSHVYDGIRGTLTVITLLLQAVWVIVESGTGPCDGRVNMHWNEELLSERNWNSVDLVRALGNYTIDRFVMSPRIEVAK